MKKWTIFAYLFSMLYVSAACAGVECLSGEAARNAFVDEKSEPYFSLLQPREMAAKTGAQIVADTLQFQRDKARSAYLGAILDCTPEELEGLKGYISIIDSSVKPSYPRLVELPWRFIKVKDHIEGGLPHTRGNAIVLSESLLKSMSLSAQKQRWELGLIHLLIHEQVHVIQRARSKEFAGLYEQWGFRKANSISGAEVWLAIHQIVNPDGVDVLWVWQAPGSARVIWPRVILAGESAKPSMPKDFRMVGIELVPAANGYLVQTDKKGEPRLRNLVDEPAYVDAFAGVTSLYHPNEIAADYLADLALWDCLLDKNKASAGRMAEMDERYKPIRKWAQQILAP